MERKPIKTIQNQVYQILRDEICEGKYAPNQRLQEVDVATQLDVSRSPVREAFRQLISDGLLISSPNKGVYIKEFSEKDIEEVFELRVLLENYAISQCSGGLSVAQRSLLSGIGEDLQYACRKKDVKKYMLADERLHSAIVSGSGNALLERTYVQINVMIKQFISCALKAPSRLADSEKEHEEIIGFLLDNNLAEAMAADRRHLETTKGFALQALHQ